MKFSKTFWSLIGLGFLAALSQTETTIGFQDEEKPLEVLVSYEPRGIPKKLQSIALRPNGNLVQPVYIHLKNPGLLPRRDVQVTLIGDTGQIIKEYGRAIAPLVPAGETVLVKFDKVEVKAEPKKDIPGWPLVEGPPFPLEIRLEEKGNNKGEITKIALPATIMEPSQYISVEEKQYDSANRKLLIRLKLIQDMDKPVPVQLVLPPSAMPTLKPVKAGAFEQELSRENPEVVLTAENIQFDGLPPANGLVYINADGYARAFMFRANFAIGGGGVTELKNLDTNKARARILLPRYLQPKAKLEVPIEVDNFTVQLAEAGKPAPLLWVEFGFDRAGIGEYIVKNFPGVRDQKVWVLPSEDGALQFKAKVEDRKIEIPTRGIYGRRSFRVRILDNLKNVQSLADEKSEGLILYDKGPGNPFAPLGVEGNKNVEAVVAEVVIDDSPVEDVALFGVPVKTLPGTPIRPRVVSKIPGPNQAPVDRVEFFFGEPEVENKLPEKIKTTLGVWDEKINSWVAREEMIIPSTARDRMAITAAFTTASGIVTTLTRGIIVEDPDALVKKKEEKKKVKTVLTGQVVRGSLSQIGVAVVLTDEKGKEKAAAKSDKSGKWVIRDVEPGKYTLTAAQPALNHIAVIPIEVKEGVEEMKNLDLKLKVK